MVKNDSSKEHITLTGTVMGIIYTNEENGYTICEISNDEMDFTATGYMPYISEGENIEIYGCWVNHPEYGEQFSAKSYKTILPSDKNAILHYLSSGIVPGIREATAKKIVDKFDTDAFNIMLNYPERLSEISGISKAKAIKIGEEFYKLQSMSGIVMFLQQFNLSAKIATKVHMTLGSEAVEKIKENPYILSDTVDGVTFKTADNIAHILGFAKNSTQRICSFLKYTLTQAAYQHGHTYLPRELLLEHISANLGVSQEEADNAITSLSVDKDIFIDTVGGVSACYLMSLLTAELYVAKRICTLSISDQQRTMTVEDTQAAIDEISSREGIILAEEQQRAVHCAVSNGCIIITGGPGTGKTTTINTIIKILEKLNLKLALAAPTGRAAKRMSEVTGLEAKTIHRLLGVVKNDSELHVTFSKNEDNPLCEDVIIIDEMSMLDITLMSALLKAVKPGAKVIMVGDADQLPSVGPGNVLRDLIEAQMVPVIQLEHIFRQAQESLIVVNAHKINRGEAPVITHGDTDFFFIRRNTSEEIANTICELYTKRLPEKYNINPINSIQILSPSRKGSLGITNLNTLLQSHINPHDYMKGEYTHSGVTFRVGDKVMQNKNNYDITWIKANGEEGMGIFNGDIGVIQKISSVDKVFEIVFDEDKLVEYSFNSLDELELAYAVTVHKSQGNEFPFVIIPIYSFAPMLMFRNLLYTAITRAKQMVILVGEDKNVYKMIANNDIIKRYTGLTEKIKLIENMFNEQPF